MKKPFLIGLALTTMIFMVSCSSNSGSVKAGGELKTFDDSVAYALGYYIAFSNNEQNWEPVSVEQVVHGLNDFYDDGDSSMLMDRETAIKMLRENGKKAQERIQIENEEKGKAFLDNNKSKEGVVTLESGLQYKVIKEGDGAIPGPGAKVKVHYTGKFIDGSVFQSSKERGEPIELDISQTMAGWQEAMGLMKTGSSWELYIPAELAYGDRGREGIAPGSTLVFELDLFEIVENEKTEE